MVPPSLPVVSLLTLLEAIPGRQRGREGVRDPTPPLPTPTHPNHRPPCAPTNGSVSTHTHDTQLRDFFPSAQSPSASSRLLRQETSVSTPPPPLGLSFTPFSSSLYPLRFIGRLRHVVRSLLLGLFALRFSSAEQICRTTSLRLIEKHRQQTFASLNFESKVCSLFFSSPPL